jgi:pimeloyl-ACP methyl ester carboxylesterase
MREPTQLDATIDLAGDALGGGLATIEGMHRAIAHKPFAALRRAPAVGEVSEAVRIVHDGITAFVYASLGTAIAFATGAARVALYATGVESREPRAGSNTDLALAALNGYSGEHLEQRGSPLATKMTLRHAGQALPIESKALAAAFPTAASRLAVFVHGLACNETLWRRHAELHYGDGETTYGSRLQNDLGYTPLYVRYNTGLHISDNGARLAAMLEEIIAAWPVPVSEVVLMGHSMGGLVARSAAHRGNGSGHRWIQHVRHLVYLGSPHHGAPLEKTVNVAAWLLSHSDITRPLAALINVRSSGIKDLRFGAVSDDDWRDVDLDALLSNRAGDLPLLDGASHYFVSASLTQDATHPWGIAIGDAMVRQPSATARHVEHAGPRHFRHFGSMGHLDLLNHPSVYEQIRDWLD